MAKPDGGPAFPGGLDQNADYTRQFCEPMNPGMSLRDVFAAAALPFCLREFGGNADDGKQFAEAAYQIADLMIAEREKKDAES